MDVGFGMSSQKEFVVIHKAGTVRSFIEDMFSFGGFIAVMWFNHAYLAGNGWLDFLFIVLWIITASNFQSSRYHKFKSEDEAIKYLEGVK